MDSIQARFGEPHARFDEPHARFGEPHARFGDICAFFGEPHAPFERFTASMKPGEVNSRVSCSTRDNRPPADARPRS
jgi:hypothetical protein